MKVSVVLCTYNSGRFINRFLQGIAAQTLQPNEVIVSDDGSSDNTLQIVEKFKNQLNISVFKNQKNLGYAQNFSSALMRASGELIFPADHDDVWLPKKIEFFVESAQQSSASLFFCNSFLVDENLSIKGDYWSSVNLSEFERSAIMNGNGLPLFLRRGVIPGHAMAIRGDFLQRALPVPPHWDHDHWLCIVVSAIGSIHCLDKKLIYYVLHQHQAVGMQQSSGFHRIFKALRRSLGVNQVEYEKIESLRNRLLQNGLKSEKKSMIEGKLEHCRVRAGLRRNIFPRFIQVVKEWSRGGYQRYENGLSSAIKDLLSH